MFLVCIWSDKVAFKSSKSIFIENKLSSTEQNLLFKIFLSVNIPLKFTSDI